MSNLRVCPACGQRNQTETGRCNRDYCQDAFVGRRYRDGLVWRFEPAEPIEREPERDLSKLVACPTCHAKVTEVCRTKSGHTTTPHGSRLTGRLCACGEVAPAKASRCELCAARVLQESKNEYGQRVRARRVA